MSKTFHGLLLVDKPSGLTSHDVVNRVRRIMGTKTVGHSGTLDPLASGLMVCLINEGTKLSQYILEGDKTYRVRAQFGVRTDTLDITGQVLEKKEVNLSRDQILAAAHSLEGEFEFAVPIFSAVKVQGKRLYDYAREEQEVIIPRKKMRFFDIRLIDSGTDWAEFDISCSKGGFIRTWVEEVGKKLGCGAALSSLRRIWSQPYEVINARTLEDLEKDLQGPDFSSGFVSMDAALPGRKRIRVKGHDEVLLGNGQISHDLRVQLITIFDPAQDLMVQIFSQSSGRMLALVGLEEGRGFVLRRVFHYKDTN